MSYKRTSPQPVIEGGTGNTSFTSNGILIGNGTGAISVITAGTTGQVLTGVTSGAPTFQTLPSSVISINVQTFTASGTYTPTSGMLYCTIEVVGGGGGGGASTTTTGSNTSSASGGGGGGYARKTVSAAIIGASQTVTVGAGGTAGVIQGGNGGAGGTTSVGTIVSATGGAGGYGSVATNSVATSGVSGGIGSSGDINIAGNSSVSIIFPIGTQYSGSGSGGSSIFGAAGTGGITSSGFSLAGNVGGNYGGGGSGSVSYGIATGKNGGAGAPGIVIITEYI